MINNFLYECNDNSTPLCWIWQKQPPKQSCTMSPLLPLHPRGLTQAFSLPSGVQARLHGDQGHRAGPALGPALHRGLEAGGPPPDLQARQGAGLGGPGEAQVGEAERLRRNASICWGQTSQGRMLWQHAADHVDYTHSSHVHMPRS